MHIFKSLNWNRCPSVKQPNNISLWSLSTIGFVTKTCCRFVAGKTKHTPCFLWPLCFFCVNYQTAVIVTCLIYVYFSGQVVHCATMATSTSLSSDCIDPYSGSHGYSLLSFSCDAYSRTEAQLLQANVSQHSTVIELKSNLGFSLFF